MSTTTNRDAADEDSLDRRLTRLFDSGALARVVPHLPPETLHQLVRYRGLESSVDLLTAATSAQLAALVDLDLWRHAQPGGDDRFDVERFGEWLEALVNAGDVAAIRIVVALDRRTLVAGFSRYVRVFDPGTFEPTESIDDESMDRHEMMHSETSLGVLDCELGGYLIRARRTDTWDAIVTLLAALESQDDACFHAVMQGCRALSNSRPEFDGLDELLLVPEQYLHDAAIEREDRRSHHGYATPAGARAFLRMARQSSCPPATSRARATGPTSTACVPCALTTMSRNSIVAAYFRATNDGSDTGKEQTSPEVPDGRPAQTSAAETSPSHEVSESIDAVIELLTKAGLAPQRPRALLEASDTNRSADKFPRLRRLMTALVLDDDEAGDARARELAFLANTLLAGCSIQSRPFTPQEAADAAACVCNLGLECWSEDSLSDTFLAAHDLLAVFELGWSVLHRDVSLFVADALLSIVETLPSDDADTARELRHLHRQLAIHREARTPWLARDAAAVLAQFDMAAWVSVIGLLDECPMRPDALTAILERRTTPVSPTAFAFISTTTQVADIRLFVQVLPSVLAR